MEKRYILIIDDEPSNLDLLEAYLKLGIDSDHEILSAQSGKEGLNILSQFYNSIDVILLDRMMPEMSGIDFMKIFNQNAQYKNIPVIMQTASDVREHIAEGFKLGIYHYLVKPLSAITLNAIVHSAIEFNVRQRALLAEIKSTKNLFKFVEHAAFQIRTVEEVELISVSLASLFPNPERVVNGIAEILVNAIEHGNLGITYDEKTKLNIEQKWKDEIDRRLMLLENQEKRVTITLYKTDDALKISVRDQGKGFDYEKYLEFDPARGTDSHGRGIAFANKLSFDSIHYLGNGNEVVCSVMLKPPNLVNE